MSTKILHSPEALNSTACVIQDGPLGALYVQCIDAYGFQRELSVHLFPNSGKADVTVYQHPGRRDVQTLPHGIGRQFVVRFADAVTKYPGSLFNAGTLETPRCRGFVGLCERLHRGQPALDALSYS